MLVSLAALGWYLVLIFQARHTFGGLPTPEAFAALARSLQRAWEHSRVDFAPVPIRPGYEMLIVTAMFLSATFGELASFRWRRPVLAVLLPIVLFSVSLIVGTGAAAPLLTLLFLASLLTYWALESSHRMRAWGRWVSAWTHHRNVEPASLSGGLARRLGATCLVAAFVSPLFLPALGDGLVSWRSGLGGGLGEGSGGSGRSVDPWVSITPSLVNQSPDVLFEVESDQASYWRVASLERFDGEVWHEDTGARMEVEGGNVDVPGPPLTHSEEIAYSLVSTGLGGDALPTAPTAAEVRSEEHGSDLRFDPDSGNVFATSGIETGDDFRIVSTVADVGYKDLRRADTGTRDSLPPTYFHVPASPSVQVMELLEGWTEDAKTPYEQLVAIQTELRAYSYTLTPESPRGDDYVADFLLRTQAGYCQQYATAFAIAARYLDFPSRVSVGFLPGERELGSSTYRVTGADAHAWPEVFFPEYGWIAFEPTPRNDFGALPPAYTSPPLAGGLANINPDNPFSSTGLEGQGQAALSDAFGDPGGGRRIETGGGLRGSEDAPGAAPAENQAWQKTFGRVLTVLLIALLLFLIAVPLLKEIRIRRRYAQATDPDSIAASAFVHFQEESAELAAARHPWESASAFALRMRTSGALSDTSAGRLAELYEMAAYAAADISALQAAEAKRLAKRLRGQLWSGAPWPARAVRLFSPRSLRSLG